MFKVAPYTVALLFLLLTGVLRAESNLKGVRVWSSPESTRIVFDLSAEQKYELTTHSNPNRLILEMPNAKWQANVASLKLKNTGIQSIIPRTEGKTLVVTIDLEEARTERAFALKPQAQYGHRLVIDLEQPQASDIKVAVRETASTPLQVVDKPTEVVKQVVKSSAAVLPKKKEFVIALDPGHGGEDPGAIGRHFKTREKDIVLNVAYKLANLINREPGMKAILIRKGDYYVGLRKRMEIARKQDADLFISIHADSFTNTTAMGASVFVLSERGASSEAARWLAEKENSSDLIGGVSLDDKGSLLASVLLDLSQTANQSASEDLAGRILGNINQVASLHHNQIQRAGFAVLKSPDVPSILIELGFLSNRQSEERLRTDKHQNHLAHAIFSGVTQFASKRSSPSYVQSGSPRSVKKAMPASRSKVNRGDFQFSQKNHKVQRGETLTKISKQYKVSVERIKVINKMKSGQVNRGQVLIIPSQEDA